MPKQHNKPYNIPTPDQLSYHHSTLTFALALLQAGNQVEHSSYPVVVRNIRPAVAIAVAVQEVVHTHLDRFDPDRIERPATDPVLVDSEDSMVQHRCEFGKGQ